MDNPKEIRWRQRFLDFEKSLKHLEKALAIATPDEVYQAGIIQFFEVSFELAWKTMKDYLEAQGYKISSPRQTIQQAFQVKLITEGHTWIEALEKRNMMAHTYDEARAKEAENLIRLTYFNILSGLYNTLKIE